MIRLDRHNITHQDILRQVEVLCTQEEPPACMAACPLHLDARALCALLADGALAKALQLYEKTIPFARIIGRTCDAPCQTACLRSQTGGSIRIQELEAHLVSSAGPARVPPFLPKKAKRAAVVGGGLSGMTCAFDLARKGYGVTLYEAGTVLGGRLRKLPEQTLPVSLLEEEIQTLLQYNIHVELETTVPLHSVQEAVNFLLASHDAAFIACSSPLDELADPNTLLIKGQTALLGGQRQGRLTGGPSSIYDVFDGRSAATTIDRLFQSVNVNAGRAREGSQETTLYTNLKNIPDLPPVTPGDQGYTGEQAQAEAARCIQCECMECVKQCAFLEHYGRSPRKYVREVYNNLSIAMGQHHANDMINNCALCGQCEVICPNGLDLKQVFRAAREHMVQSDKMPPSAFEFAMLDMDYSLSEAAYVLAPDPDRKLTKYVFFPGCQLPASEPDLVRRTYDILRQTLSGGVGLWLSCCGIMAHWGGEEALFRRVAKRLKEDWEALGSPIILSACPTCTATLEELLQLPVQSIFEVLQPKLNSQIDDLTGQTMILHHACGSRHRPDLKDQVSRLAAECGILLTESALTDDTHPCCGYGGLVDYHDRNMADRITLKAQQQLGPELPILTYCVNCRDRHLTTGRKSYHLLELLLPDPDQTNHQPPTFSQRQDNRTELKRQLLEEFWQTAMKQEQQLKLYLSDEIEAKLEARHILKRELSEAIRQAENNQRRLIDPSNGHYTTSWRPGNVTFWVEYLPEDDGWRIINAYSHRMSGVLTDHMTGGRIHE